MSETQTTLERLTEILGGARNSRIAMVAAEIDGLTAQLAEAKPKVDAWDARQAYIREPGDDGRLYENWESAEFNIIMAQKNAQLAEARAIHQHCDLLLDSANAELRECQSALRLALAGTEQKYFAIPARIDDVRAALADAQAQLAEARAEVERLRPAAEAWKLQRKYAAMFADNLRGRASDADLACLEAEYEAAAARAREARK